MVFWNVCEKHARILRKDDIISRIPILYDALSKKYDRKFIFCLFLKKILCNKKKFIKNLQKKKVENDHTFIILFSMALRD